MRCRPDGPTSSVIAIVGEAPGVEEEASGLPFVGASGKELTRMLRDAGITREACFITNLTHERPPNNEIETWISFRKTPPDASFVSYRGAWVKPFIVQEQERLCSEIRSVSPNIVICLGNTPLWALCGERGISKWRGSQLTSDTIPGLKIIPAYHPAFILRSYEDRWITVNDLKRAKKESVSPILEKPSYSFAIGPTFAEAMKYLENLLERLDHGPTPFTLDLEIYRKEILCVGIGLSRHVAFCLPFLCLRGHYWTPEERPRILGLLGRALLHPNARLINQNISFDIQYLFWRFFLRPRAAFDTMIGQNVLFSGLPKDLAFLASMYNDYYVYWKDDGKFWIKYESDEKIWTYNCVDCVATFEVWEHQQTALKALNLDSQMAFQMRTFENMMDLMIRGVRVDRPQRAILRGELDALIDKLHAEVSHLTGTSLVGEKGDFSSKKLTNLFYNKLKLKPIWKLVEGDYRLTCDDEALKKIAHREPWLRPLTDRINMIRSYGTAVDVCNKAVDKDGRWRTAFNVAGTTTYRLASSENPFDSGLNLQNLTLGRDILQ